MAGRINRCRCPHLFHAFVGIKDDLFGDRGPLNRVNLLALSQVDLAAARAFTSDATASKLYLRLLMGPCPNILGACPGQG